MCVFFSMTIYCLIHTDFSGHSKQTFAILITDLCVCVFLPFLMSIHVVGSPIVLDDYTNMVWSLHAFAHFNFIYFKLTLNMLQQNCLFILQRAHLAHCEVYTVHFFFVHFISHTTDSLTIFFCHSFFMLKFIILPIVYHSFKCMFPNIFGCYELYSILITVRF